MFNRVKFVIKKSLFQNSKNKGNLAKNKNLYNKTKAITSTSIKFNQNSIRKFSSYSNNNYNPPEPPTPNNILFILTTIICGSLFVSKKYIF